MNSTAELLDRVLADLDTVRSDDGLAALSNPQRMAVLQVAGAVFRRAEAVVVETIALGDMGDLPHAAGCRGMNELLQRTTRIDARTAVRVDRVVGERVRRTLSLAGERLPARWPELPSPLKYWTAIVRKETCSRSRPRPGAFDDNRATSASSQADTSLADKVLTCWL